MIFRRAAVLVLGLSLLSNSAAAAEVAIVVCGVGTPLTVVKICDKSRGVSATCPSPGTSCAQALATFQSSPDNLRLRSVENVSTSNLTTYTLISGERKD